MARYNSCQLAVPALPGWRASSCAVHSRENIAFAYEVAELVCLTVLLQLFKIVPLSSLGVGPEVSNNMSELRTSYLLAL